MQELSGLKNFKNTLSKIFIICTLRGQLELILYKKQQGFSILRFYSYFIKRTS